MSYTTPDSLRDQIETLLQHDAPYKTIYGGEVSHAHAHTSILVDKGFLQHATTPPQPDWYVLTEPSAAPRLIRTQRVTWSAGCWQVDGEDMDTQQSVTGEDLLFVLGPSEADAEPFRRDHEARRRPWEHHTVTV